MNPFQYINSTHGRSLIGSIMVQVTVIVLILTLLETVNAEQSLYATLGVRKTATQKEIKQAYKRLAREWHPDKTDDPDATDRFTKINEAYETLGDAEKRQQYDQFGYTSANARQPNRQQYGFQGDPFDSFFSGQFNFNFGGKQGGAESIIDKHIITLREYESTILPNSGSKPCVIYAFTDFCFNCMRVESTVEKFITELKTVGVCVATFHASRTRNLAATLRVTSVPSIVGVINERVTFFNGPVSLHSLHEFTRNLFPTNFITKIYDTNIDRFLSGWPVDNKVRGIFFSPREDITARFLASAFYYKDNLQFGFVYTRSASVKEVVKRFNINAYRETLLLFNEETNSPVATISMQQLSRSSLDEVIEGNKYLILPRLSSQKFFDELCPEEYKVRYRKLCVVLITKKADVHDTHREGFRRYSQKSRLAGNDRVKFTYMYEDTQQEFVKALMKGKQLGDAEEPLKVAILWRVEKYEMKYEWLESGWKIDEEKQCGQSLETRLNVLLTTDTLMAYKTKPPQLYNEHGLGLLLRIGYRLLNWAERLMGYVTMFDSSSWITLMLSLMFVFGMAYFMHKLATLEEIQVQATMPQKTQPRPPSRTYDTKNIKLYELDYRSYEQLVSEADTGLTITVLVDKDNKDRLIKQFASIVHSYSRYSGLTFAFIQLEYNISWYKKLLETSVDDVKLDKINIRNCIGTVLALNGYRKYYYIYSVKKGREFIRKRNNVSKALGLDDLDEQSDEELNENVQDREGNENDEYFFVDELLDGLALWLDKIFDGSMKRIRITEWPDMSG